VNHVAFGLHWRIELARREVAAPLNGPVVSHLDDPGACGTFGTVKDRALPMDKEEQVLDEIVSLCRVSEYTGCYAANDSRIAWEQASERFLIALCNTGQ